MTAMQNMQFNEDDLEPLHEVLDSVSEPKHFGTRLLADLWSEREGEDGFVIGRDVPSRRIARVMHNLMLLQPIVEGGRVKDMRVRIAGDTLNMRFGVNPTGMLLSELFPEEDFAQHLIRTNQVLDESVPLILRSELRRGRVTERRLEIAVLPVWNAGRTERWILAGVFYFN